MSSAQGERGSERHQHVETPVLDVSYSRFAEWLLERRLLPFASGSASSSSESKDGNSDSWRARVSALRQQSRQAAEEAAGLFHSQVPTAMMYSRRTPSTRNSLESTRSKMPDFVDCCKMLDELKAASLLQKQTEDTTSASNSSSFFAIMNSAVGLKQSDSQLLPLPRLIKEFERILESYEQDNLYLGEAAMVMVQIVDYDIPFVRASQQRAIRAVSELERKAKDARHTGSSSGKLYRKMCLEMGIGSSGSGTSSTARDGLIKKICRDLPLLLRRLVDSLRSEEVREAVELYKRYIDDLNPHTSMQRGDTGIGTGVLSAFDELCSIEELGDSIYMSGLDDSTEKDGQKDKETSKCMSTGLEKEEIGTQIDWDLCIEEANTAEAHKDDLVAEIDWDVGEINIEIDAEGLTVLEDDAMADNDIDWDIDVVGGNVPDVPDAIDLDIVEEVGPSNVDQSLSEGTSLNDDLQGTQVMTAVQYMSDSSRRNKVIDEMIEVKSFLLQRLKEEGSHSNALGTSNSLAIILGATKIRRLITAVDKSLVQVLPSASSDKTEDGNDLRHLLLMHSSGRYLARSAVAIDQLREQELRLQASASAMESKAQGMSQTLIAQYVPELSYLQSHVCDVKRMAERRCGEILGDRTVKIIGDINKL